MCLNTPNAVICISLCTKRTEHFRICSELHTNQLRRNGMLPIWSLMIRPTSRQMSSYNPAGYKIHSTNMVYIHNKCNEYRESYSVPWKRCLYCEIEKPNTFDRNGTPPKFNLTVSTMRKCHFVIIHYNDTEIYRY